MSLSETMRFMMLAVAILTFTISGLDAEDWPHWRGPTSNGIAPVGPPPPLTWDENTNIVWRTKLPGRGHGSPTVVDDRIYLATADEPTFVQSVMAIDRESGTIFQ